MSLDTLKAGKSGLRVLLLTRYGNLGASSRIRFLQYIPWMEKSGFYTLPQPLLSDEMLAKCYGGSGYGMALLKSYFRRCNALLNSKQFDLVWIEKEALPWWPLWSELSLLRKRPYVLDYDDAVFHNYDQHRFGFVRFAFGHRLDGLMSQAALVVGGNDYLAQRARDAGADRVEVLPTVIDLARYPYPNPVQASRNAHTPVVVWIGSPSTVRYLYMLHAPLQALAKRQPFILRVIGGDVTLHGVQVECVPWTENTEVTSIAGSDIGVMPLLDSPWERGKCGYKLIQYMACGLPVVASPVGVNNSIVQEGVNGYLAEDTQTWVNCLERLLKDENLRKKMGSSGRLRVEQEYCLQVTGPRLAAWLRTVAQKGK